MLRRLDQGLALSASNVFMALLYLGAFIALGDEAVPRWLALLSTFVAGSAAGMHAQIVSSRLQSIERSPTSGKTPAIQVGASRRGI